MKYKINEEVRSPKIDASIELLIKLLARLIVEENKRIIE
tara:strand:- start:59613 stop:59729 length:117 start_codon:yes stop_codon:yes gene_type:complete